MVGCGGIIATAVATITVYDKQPPILNLVSELLNRFHLVSAFNIFFIFNFWKIPPFL